MERLRIGLRVPCPGQGLSRYLTRKGVNTCSVGDLPRGGPSMRVELNQLAGRVGPTFESRCLQRCPALSAGTGEK
jgi:hypothetical protein